MLVRVYVLSVALNILLVLLCFAVVRMVAFRHCLRIFRMGSTASVLMVWLQEEEGHPVCGKPCTGSPRGHSYLESYGGPGLTQGNL